MIIKTTLPRKRTYRSDPKKKFDDWVNRIYNSISNKDYYSLSFECKRLSYWLKKIAEEEPTSYPASEHKSTELLRSSALLMKEESQRKINDLRKHRVDTKIRYTKLMSYIYNYHNFTRPLLEQSGLVELAYSIMDAFNAEFLEEVVRNSSQRDVFHAYLMVKYLNKCIDLGLAVKNEDIKFYQDIVICQEKKIYPFYLVWLNIAGADLAEDKPIQGLVLFCEGLRAFVKYLCELNGVNITYDGSILGNEKPFDELLSNLSEKGILKAEHVILFKSINDGWYKKIGSSGFMLPRTKLVNRSIEDVLKIINEIENNFIKQKIEVI